MSKVKAILRLLCNYILYFFSFFLLRNKNKWVFGSPNGFACNPKYLFLDILEKNRSINAIWISKDINEYILLKSKNLPVFSKNSIYGLYHCLTSGVYVYSYNLSDINIWTSGSARRVNLWHGVGIKNIEFKSTVGPTAKLYMNKSLLNKIRNIQFFLKPNVFLSTSKLMTSHFSECFMIGKEKCIEAVYPRCQFLFNNKDYILDHIRKYESDLIIDEINKISTHRKVYLYMPTWRDNEVDFITYSKLDFNVLNNILKERNELFLIKLHPNTKIELNKINQLSNVTVLSNKIDVYAIIPFSDVLITDYSSIYYDYILTNKKVIIYSFDYEDYVSNSRDLAFDFNEYTPGVRAKTFEDLVNILKLKQDLYSNYFEEIEDVKIKFWGSANVEPLNEILNKLTLN